MKLKTSLFNDLSMYATATVLTCIILVVILHCASFQYNIPLNYTGDSFLTCTIVKSIIETGHYTLNPFLGAPLSSDITDFPMYSIFVYVAVKIIALFSKDYTVVLNTFYFSTFFLITWFSLFVFRRLGLSKTFSIVASVLFSFLPFHWMRNEAHLILSIYFCVPIYVLLAFDVFNTPHAYSKPFIKISAGILCIIAALSSAASGAYLVFFGICILFVAGVITSLNQQNTAALRKASIFIVISIISVLINILPYVAASVERGRNPEVAHRFGFESEYSPLKITQLVLPVDNHRIGPFRIKKSRYNQSAPLVNENTMATLGVIGSIGFIILLAILLVRRWGENKALFNLSVLNISLVLLGMLGGFGSLLAYTIYPGIRSYNRVSIFIAFFSFCAFFLVLEKWLKQKSISRTVYYSIAVLLLVIGMLDQTPRRLFQTDLKKQYASDAAFIHQIEAVMPANSMIFQLPYAVFPEAPPINLMGIHDHARAYLHSHTLRWSYQAMSGYPVTTWQQNVSHEPAKQMLNDLAFAGFTGVYIDRYGYQDNGALLEKQIASLVDTKPVISSDRREVFYDLRNYVAALKKSLGPKRWADEVNKTFHIVHAKPNWWKTR